MAALLGSAQLLDCLLSAVESSGWHAIVLSKSKPFRLRIFDDQRGGFPIAAYIWNCTHGGGAARAANEYRIQLTGAIPTIHPDQTTLLLGWHGGYGVFVAFDIGRHTGQDSSSPSIQIAEQTLQAAHRNAFALHKRQTAEIAVAFRPEFLVDYALNCRALHRTGKATADMSLLNDLSSLTDERVATVTNHERKIVIGRFARKYRAADFRGRVLGAYRHQCAVCGVQLGLIDAAHIIPVGAPTSTDETANGIALCKLHHAAFDNKLLSFDEGYRVEVSESALRRFAAENLVAGLAGFRTSLRPVLILPNDRRDYPPPAYIKEARAVRRWAV